MRNELYLTAVAVCAVSFVLLGYAQNAEAAAYLKFEGISGEATDKDHKDWINLLSFEHTISRESSSSSARARGAAVFGDFVITKTLDKSTPKLTEAIAKGQVIPKVEFHLATGAGTYLSYELKNVMVTSYSISGDADDRPTEQISLNYGEIKITYTESGSDGKSKGNVEFTWKVEEGTS